MSVQKIFYVIRFHSLNKFGDYECISSITSDEDIDILIGSKYSYIDPHRKEVHSNIIAKKTHVTDDRVHRKICIQRDYYITIENGII